MDAFVIVLTIETVAMEATGRRFRVVMMIRVVRNVRPSRTTVGARDTGSADDTLGGPKEEEEEGDYKAKKNHARYWMPKKCERLFSSSKGDEW